MKDPLQESADLLEIEDIGTIRKVEVIRKLLKFRKDPRVGEILKSKLAVEKDPEVLKTIILGFGYIKDARYVTDLVPFLDNESFRVMAATIKSICKIDAGQDSDMAHALVVSKDGRTRTASILALLSFDRELGLEAIGQLGSSQSTLLRRTAAQCLEADPQATASTAIDMLVKETDKDLVDRLALILKRAPSRPGLERLYELKAALLADPDETLAGKKINETKIHHIEELCAHFKTHLDVSSDGIGTLEGKLDKHLDQRRTEKERLHEEQHKGRVERLIEARTQQHKIPPGSRAAIVAVLGIGLVGGIANWTIRRQLGEKSLSVPLSRAAIDATRTSRVGKIGDTVAFECRVMRVFKAHGSLSVQAPDGVIAITTFVKGLPTAATSGLPVYLEGTISGIRSENSIYIEGKSLSLANVPQ